MQSALPQKKQPLVARIGHFWFKWRSLSPLPLFFLYFFLKPDFKLSSKQQLLIALFIFLAEALRVWAVSYAGSRTRTRSDNVIDLVHAGPYRFVRNPLYIANILMYFLVGIFFGFITLSVCVLLYSCLQYSFIVQFEENILERDIGAPYIFYKQKVPRWIPSFVPSIQTSRHTLNILRGVRSERSTFYSILAMGVLYLLKARFFAI